MQRRGGDVTQVANSGAPDALKSTVRYVVDGTSYRDMRVKIYSTDPKAIFEEKGTKPHVIRPRRARVLVFPGTNHFKGTTVYTKLVNHPGTAGTHFLKNALRRVIGR